jgi:acetolactate synthase-1/2/3 large subunit
MTRNEWIAKCNEWKDKWLVMQEEYRPADSQFQLNIYAVLDAINQHSSADDILMGDAGSISYAGPVALNAKQGQRFIFSPAQADMGWALPAAVGVSMASDQPVISIIGNGSFMSNVQELAVVKQHELDIKLVILNNNGYLSIKNTQQKYFNGRVYGTSGETGLWFPSMKNIATAFGMPCVDIRTKEDLRLQIPRVLKKKGPVIIDCQCLSEQEILPAQALKNGKQAGLHNMTPFLSQSELEQEMIVKID